MDLNTSFSELKVLNKFGPLLIFAMLVGQICIAQGQVNDTIRSRPSEGTANDIEADLINILPQPNSIFPDIKPGNIVNKKNEFFQNKGLALGVSYQGTVQSASASMTENHLAAGGWFLLEMKWILVNRGKDFQGSFFGGLDWRHAYGNAEPPGYYRLQTGSLWAHDAAFFDWDFYLTAFFWEQWFRKDRFFIRVGQLTTASMFDYFRFGDFRTQFSNSQLTFPAATVPLGPPGLGLNFKWWPIVDSELYVVGSITDINAPPPTEGRYDWSGIFETGELMAALEVGYYWRRSEGDYDHLHVGFWYADSMSRKSFGSTEGFGFRVSGHKQWQRWVGYGVLSYNTSRGGGFGFTNSSHSADLGIAFLNPLNVKGEVIAGLSWGRPLDEPDPFTGQLSDLDQYSAQINWRLLITPDLYITPGAQFIFNPSYNPYSDFIFMPQAKFRIFF